MAPQSEARCTCFGLRYRSEHGQSYLLLHFRPRRRRHQRHGLRLFPAKACWRRKSAPVAFHGCSRVGRQGSESRPSSRSRPTEPAGSAMNEPGRRITQTLHTFRADRLDPFGHRLGRLSELVDRIGLAQATFHHASDCRLSTFGRQRRSLVDVHLVSPWSTEASQPQLLRFN